jgi:hypothetical protein
VAEALKPDLSTVTVAATAKVEGSSGMSAGAAILAAGASLGAHLEVGDNGDTHFVGAAEKAIKATAINLLTEAGYTTSNKGGIAGAVTSAWQLKRLAGN